MRRSFIVFSSLLSIGILVGGCASTPGGGRAGLETGAGEQSGSLVRADRLVKIDTVTSLNDATMRHVQLVDGKTPELVLYDPTNSEYPRAGIWTSSEQDADFPFTEMIASWNAECPAETGVRFFERVRDAKSHQWSGWLYTGYWGNPSPIERVIRFSGGWVDEDTLKLKEPADGWQIQAKLESFDTDVKVNPVIRRISVVYEGKTTAEKAKRAAAKSGIPDMPKNWAVDIPVPFRAQGDTPLALRSQTCSPTSVSMVMAFWGKSYPTAENAVAIWDKENELFGNWNRAVARAGSVGLDAWVTQFANLDQARAVLASGQPIIASIRFKRGQFPSGIFPVSAGHLIVLRGVTPEGDIICNDPASRKYGANVVYKAADIDRVWIQVGGAGYIIKGTTPAGKPVASHTPRKRKMDNGRVIMSE